LLERVLVRFVENTDVEGRIRTALLRKHSSWARKFRESNEREGEPLYKKATLILAVIGLVTAFFLFQERWETAPVLTYRTVDEEKNLQTYYGVGKEKDIMAVGSLAYYKNGKNTWLFWGDYEKQIGQVVQIYAKKKDDGQKINAVSEGELVLEEGIWGADAHVSATVQLPEAGLWSLWFVAEKQKLKELVVKIEE
jgi:hypothetical protein